MAEGKQPILAVIYDDLARQGWEELSEKCPGTFRANTFTSSLNEDCLRRAKEKYALLFKSPATPSGNGGHPKGHGKRSAAGQQANDGKRVCVYHSCVLSVYQFPLAMCVPGTKWHQVLQLQQPWPHGLGVPTTYERWGTQSLAPTSARHTFHLLSARTNGEAHHGGNRPSNLL